MTEHRTVPVEPTEEMVIAANQTMFGTTVFQGPAMVDIYKAMLEAAPQLDSELAECVWSQEAYDIWATSCGHYFVSLYHLPLKDGFNHCPYCACLVKVGE
jgi:hypothetical protein